MTLPELQSRLGRLGVKLALRLVVDAPAGVLTEELKAALLAHKPALLATLAGVDDQTSPNRPPAPEPFWPGGPADDYDRQERAAIMEFDGGLTREAAESAAGLPDRPKLVMTAADILARKFSFDELQERCESAYRRGAHQALAFAGEIAETARNHDAAIDWLDRAESTAYDLRFNRKDEGRGMFLETVRRRMEPKRRRAGAGRDDQ